MAKVAVKTYLSTKQVELLDKVCELLGEDRSGVLRIAFFAYVKEIGALEHYLVSNPGVLQN